jgi:DNA-binding response OmpR family regulator
MSQTILFLASDPDIRRVICKALESEGYYVESAGDVGTAEDWLKRLKPDLLMVRHYTESISGYDAAVFLRNACPGIPVLMVGGLLDDIHLQNREALKDFEVFPKPFSAAELLAKVREVLLKHSLAARSESGAASGSHRIGWA